MRAHKVPVFLTKLLQGSEPMPDLPWVPKAFAETASQPQGFFFFLVLLSSLALYSLISGALSNKFPVS